MKRSLSLTFALFFGGVVFGGGGAYLVSLNLSTNGSSETEPTVANPKAENLLSPDKSQSNQESSLQRSNKNQIRAMLENPTLHSNSFERRHTIYSYVAGLSEQELSIELQKYSSGSLELSYRVQDELQTALVKRLAIVNPEAALNFAITHREPALDSRWSGQGSWYSWSQPSGETEVPLLPLVQSVFTDWALSDLDGAISKAKTLNLDVRNNALAGIFNAQSGQSLATHRRIGKELGAEEFALDLFLNSLTTEQVEDPKAVWHEVVKLIDTNNFNHSIALDSIAQQWYQQDGFSVLDEISASKLDENLKTRTISHLLNLASEENPEQAFQYALTIPSEGFYSGPLNGVVSTWSASDPEAAYQAVSNIEKSGQREQARHNIVSIWAVNEPRYILENIDRFPPSLQTSARQQAIGTIASTSPKEAAELALEQGSGAFESYLPSEVMRFWIEQDVEAAVNWVYNGPVAEEKQYNWVRALTSNLANSDPRRAFDLALKQAIPKGGSFMGMNQTGLEADVIGQLAYQNLELATELLSKVREGNTKSNAFSSVGGRYIDQGDSKKAFDLGLQLPDKQQAQYFQSISYSWARIDPEGFVESIENIPTAELRSSLARSMMSQWARRNFTNEQLAVLKEYLSDSDQHAMENQ